MTDDDLPRPLIVLGERFREIDRNASTRMEEKPLHRGAVWDIFSLVDEHLLRMVGHVEAFANVVNEELGRLTHESDAYVNAVAGRLDAELGGIFDSYDEVRGLAPGADDMEGWNLLLELHVETVVMIRDWLNRVVEFVDDPAGGMRRHGVQPGDDTEINLQLRMNPPRQLKQLTRWLERRAAQAGRAWHEAWARERSGVRHEAMIAGTLLGLWLGND